MSAKTKMPGHQPRSLSIHQLPVTLSNCDSGRLDSGNLSSGAPVSEGQRLETLLKARAAENACAHPSNARKKLWKLLRDLRAIEKVLKRELTILELMPAFDDWHRISSVYLGSAKNRDDYLAEFLSGLAKVRVPTGDGDTINKALQIVSKLTLPELPAISGVPDAPEHWRRVAALHREMSRLTGGKTYFLGCRDAAKVAAGLTFQKVSDINGALERAGAIKTVRVGDQRPGGKASEFRYLLPLSENVSAQDDGGLDL